MLRDHGGFLLSLPQNALWSCKQRVFTCPISPISRHNKNQNVLFICWSLLSFFETLNEKVHAVVGMCAESCPSRGVAQAPSLLLLLGTVSFPAWERTQTDSPAASSAGNVLPATSFWWQIINPSLNPTGTDLDMGFSTARVHPAYLALGLFCLKIMGWSKVFLCTMGESSLLAATKAVCFFFSPGEAVAGMRRELGSFHRHREERDSKFCLIRSL